MSEQIWWWVARSSGMVAAVLIALTLIWGLLLTTKVIARKGMPAWLTDMHRMLGGLTCVFIAVHLVALYLDSYVHFAWAQLFVPFQSAYRAGAVAWGIGAFWLLVVVEGTSLVQRRLPRRTWRGLHYLSYPVAIMVAVHAMTAGTDSANPLFRVVTFLLVAVLCGLAASRFRRRPTRRTGPARRVPDVTRAPGSAPDPAPVRSPSGETAAAWAAVPPEVDMFATPGGSTVRGPASDPSAEVR